MGPPSNQLELLRFTALTSYTAILDRDIICLIFEAKGILLYIYFSRVWFTVAAA